MTLATQPETVVPQELTLPQELILLLLNEESGYFRQVPGWNLNCAIVGAAIAELSLIGQIDTDMSSLVLIDDTKTGDPELDPILEAIAAEPGEHNAQYWVERLAPDAESIVDLSLERLVNLGILEHHDGDFWSIAMSAWESDLYMDSEQGSAAEFVRTRIAKVIFGREIPDPRDVVIISLLDTCDVLRFIFQLDEDLEQRVELVCKMDLIGRSIAEAVANNLTGPLVPRPGLTKPIPVASLPRIVLNRNARDGNLPALMADLANTYGPVFQLRPPFQQPMIVLAGPDTNRWAQRHGRTYMTSTKYLSGLEEVYGAHGIIPAFDGAQHYRMRKAMQPSYSRSRLEGQLDEMYRLLRGYLSTWTVGQVLPVKKMSRLLTNSQISPIIVSVESQDLIEDLIDYKERALNTRVARVMPNFMLGTPAMRRKAKRIPELLDRIQRSHTPVQRAGCPRDIVDDLLSLHVNDPQLLPESSLPFILSAPLLASMYLGDQFGFSVYSMAEHPELQERIAAEADALFEGGDPTREDFAPEKIDVTRRFAMESLRLYPSVPGSIRDVMNSCIIEDFEIPRGSRVFIAQTASHYMEDKFPDPFTFDIDRYLPPRDEHLGPGYAPFGLGTHTCLGFRWVELQLAVNLLMIAHYFKLDVTPAGTKMRISPFPSLSPGGRLKLVVSEQRRELPA